MHFFIDLNGKEKNDEAQDNAAKGQIIGKGLECADVISSHAGGCGRTNHAGSNSHKPDDTVGEGSGNLVKHRTHRQRDGLIPPPGFQLSVFNGIGHTQDSGHLDGLRGQIEKYECSNHSRKICRRSNKQNVSGNHGYHPGCVQPAAGYVPVEHRIERRGDQPDDDRDDPGKEKLSGIPSTYVNW